MARRRMSKEIKPDDKIAVTTWLTGDEYKDLITTCNTFFDKDTGKPILIKEFVHSIICAQLKKNH